MLERENIDNFIADDLALRNRNWGQIEDDFSDVQTELAKKANKEQEAWITPTLINGWTQHPLYSPLRYMKDTLGFVHISGHVVPGESTVFELPKGYRPVGAIEDIVNVSYNTTNPGLIWIRMSGLVNVRAPLGTMVSIHVIFRAEN